LILAAPRDNYGFLLASLVLRDFKIRYRNMSLGVFWSLLNPLVMMGVLTFIFTTIVPNHSIRDFHLFALCGLVVFSFFSLGWSAGTTSILSNANLIKRVPMPREIIPVSTVLANAIHFLIQIALLLGLALWAGYGVNIHWMWLAPVFALEVVFVCGLSLITSALDVYFRDVRYVVESLITVLFWLVPIFYSFPMVPERFKVVYLYNPVAAVVLACRSVLLEGKEPPESLLVKLPLVSLGVLAAGLVLFRRLERRFADHL